MEDGLASFRRDDRPDAVRLVAEGEIDLADSYAFHDALYKLIDDANSPAVIDLSRVSFFNSTGISVLIEAQQAAAHERVELTVEPSLAVRRVLEITGLTKTFDLREPA